jgi:tetrahydromethanopterin S-methyltransferase subunit G|tara:strand:+ start:349 stop:510 length:162 start_codon:yes stop_codon:yes gene_type:complete
MTDRSIESELKEVHKKIEDIEKKQEMMNKIYQMDRDKKAKMGERPSTHLHEMT